MQTAAPLAGEVDNARSPKRPSYPAVTVGGVVFKTLTRYERTATVDGRHFFAIGSNGRGYTLFEHDADITTAGRCRCIGRRPQRLDSTAALAAEILRLVGSKMTLPPDPAFK